MNMNALKELQHEPLGPSNLFGNPLYLSAPDVVELVQRNGVKACIQGIAGNIREDFLRWHEFEKTARIANHSLHGVIELMPISDHSTYSFKYVNGHCKSPTFHLRK